MVNMQAGQQLSGAPLLESLLHAEIRRVLLQQSWHVCGAEDDCEAIVLTAAQCAAQSAAQTSLSILPTSARSTTNRTVRDLS